MIFVFSYLACLVVQVIWCKVGVSIPAFFVCANNAIVVAYFALFVLIVFGGVSGPLPSAR